MNNILIVDSGSTKTDWSFLPLEESRHIIRIKSPGVNPVLMSQNDIQNIFHSVRHQLGNIKNLEIYYFGAGCNPTLKHSIDKIIKVIWETDKINL